MPATLFRDAAALDPAQLRTLDALHLAAALELGAPIDGLATYHSRWHPPHRATAWPWPLQGA
jgi:uncharacterized protein